MSLHDVDKDGVNRSAPAPNSEDQVADRLAHGTTQNQNSIEEAEANGLKFLERQIIAKENGFNKAIFGFYGDANKFGLKVAQDGVDVLTATDSQLLFNSEQNIFKIVTTGTTTQTPPNPLTTDSTDTKTIAHNLGYIPAFSVYITSGDSALVAAGSYYQLPFMRPINIAGTMRPGLRILARADATNLYIDITNFAGSGIADIGTISYKYYLMQETAN